MDWLANWTSRAREGRRLRLVFPEGDEPQILLAARRLVDEQIAHVIVLGVESAIASAAATRQVALDGIELRDPAGSDANEGYAGRYRTQRARSSLGVALRAVARPLFHAGMMVSTGDADAMVAGIALPTARVIEAALMTVGPAEGISTPSSCFVMLVPEIDGCRKVPLVFADCAVNVEPDPSQLADIAIASADTCAGLLGLEPQVALLSFSTHGSAVHARADRVREAMDLIRAKRPDIAVDGEMQADAALVERVAKAKLRRESEVAGRANVLVFPNLDAGNIGYKLVQYLGGARAYGPFLQGFARPVSDLSRGASVDDIVATAVATIARARSAM